jgi:hypothetical protein
VHTRGCGAEVAVNTPVEDEEIEALASHER